MTDLLKRIDRLIAHEDLPWQRNGSVIEVRLHEGRRQRVRIAETSGTIQIWSCVLPSTFVQANSERWGQLALRAWRKNSHADLVGFGFDRRHRLIGFAEHPGRDVRDADLRLYVEAVARESDRLEHVLLGLDQN